MRPASQAHKIRAVRGEGVPAPRSLLIVHASELLTLRGPRGPRIREAASELGIIPDGAVYVEGERIADLGTTAEVVARHPRAATTLDATGQTVVQR